MAYNLTFSLGLGDQFASSILNAQLVDTSGVDFGVPITTGFIYIGSGYFSWTTTIPSGFEGGAKIYDTADPSTLLVFLEINQENQEINIEVGHSQDNVDIVNIPALNAADPITIITGVR